MLRSVSSLVHRRGPVFWFRKSVPVDLIDRLGSSDIRRSLRTCNGRMARQRAWTLILLVEDAFAVLRGAGLSPDARSALDAIINRVMNDFDQDKRAWADRQKYRMLLDSLNGEVGGMVVSGQSSTTAVPAVLAAHMAPESGALAIEHSMLDAAAPDLSALIAQAVRDANIDPRARKPLSAFVPDYLKVKKTEVDSRTLEELGTKIRIFLETMGDLEVHAYTREHLLDYRDLLDEMPKDAIKHLRTDRLVDAISLNQKRREPLPVISPTTVNAKYLSAVRGIFTDLVLRGVLKSNPVALIKSRQILDDIEDLLDVEKRLPFSREQIAMLIEQSKQESRMSADYWFWPNAPYTGLRIGEFAQLGVPDFREHHGRMCIDLLHTPDGDPINAQRRAQLRLKSDAAYRIVALHGVVIDGGLIDFVEYRRKKDGPMAKLFPQETPNVHGLYGQNLSKRANRDIDRITEDPRHVAHCTRHFFAACCDEVFMPTSLRNSFMGHEPEEVDANGNKKVRRGKHVSARYGSPIPSLEQLSWIDRLRF